MTLFSLQRVSPSSFFLQPSTLRLIQGQFSDTIIGSSCDLLSDDMYCFRFSRSGFRRTLSCWILFVRGRRIWSVSMPETLLSVRVSIKVCSDLKTSIKVLVVWPMKG